MIKGLLKGVVFTLLFIVLVVLFMPREQLWYKLEHLLVGFEIVIDKEHLENSLTQLSVQNGVIHYSELTLGVFERIEIMPLLVENTLRISNLKAGSDLKMFKGITVQEALIKHSIFSPLTSTVEAQGSFGSLTGTMGIKGIHLTISPSKILLKNTLLRKYLTKTKKGYKYDLLF